MQHKLFGPNDLLEHLYEKPAAQIIEEDICAPLGMMENEYLAGVGPPAPTMVGYGWDMLFGNMCILGGRRNQTYCKPYCQGQWRMTSTVGDMNKWAQELKGTQRFWVQKSMLLVFKHWPSDSASKLTPRISDHLYPERLGVPDYPRYMDSIGPQKVRGQHHWHILKP